MYFSTGFFSLRVADDTVDTRPPLLSVRNACENVVHSPDTRGRLLQDGLGKDSQKIRIVPSRFGAAWASSSAGNAPATQTAEYATPRGGCC